MKLIGQTNFLSKKGIDLSSIKDKRIKIVGLGGLGSHISQSLIRMGFENITLIEADTVEESNLPRQVLFSKADVGRKKGSATIEKLQQINPNVNIRWHNEYLTDVNVNDLLQDADIVLDGTDNLTVRYTINRYCFQHHIPWVYAAAIGSVYSVAPFIPGETPCFECVYGAFDNSQDNVSCTIDGIIITTLMAAVAKQLNLAIKILANKRVNTTIIQEDIWEGNQSSFDFSLLSDAHCSGCNVPPSLERSPIHIICGNNVKEVRLNSTQLYEEAFDQNFKKNLDNQMVSTYHKGEQQITVFKDKKILFYGFSTEDVKELISL